MNQSRTGAMEPGTASLVPAAVPRGYHDVGHDGLLIVVQFAEARERGNPRQPGRTPATTKSRAQWLRSTPERSSGSRDPSFRHDRARLPPCSRREPGPKGFGDALADTFAGINYRRTPPRWAEAREKPTVLGLSSPVADGESANRERLSVQSVPSRETPLRNTAPTSGTVTGFATQRR